VLVLRTAAPNGHISIEPPLFSLTNRTGLKATK